MAGTPDAPKTLFAVALDRVLADRSMTLAGLARLTRYDPSSLSRWRGGSRPVSREVITDVVDVLGLSDDEATRCYHAAGLLSSHELATVASTMRAESWDAEEAVVDVAQGTRRAR